MNRPWQLCLVLVPFALGFSACSTDPEHQPPADAGIDTGQDRAGLWGTVQLVLQEEIPGARPARSMVAGKFYDGQPLRQVPLVVTREAGSCRLFTARIVFCNPSCSSGTACVAGNTCQPYPKVQNVGNLLVQGAGDSIVLEAVAPSFNYQSFDLPYPPCAEGANVSLTAFGDVMANHCIAPLTMESTNPLLVRRGQPFRLTWNRPARPERSRIHVLLDIAHHGGQKTGEIVCNLEDSGSYEVDATLVDGLIDLGLAGNPSVILTRISTVPSTTRPNVRFSVVASIERPVDTGVISCLDRGSVCPPGQTCDPVRAICQ